jgi:hypothetical protein
MTIEFDGQNNKLGTTTANNVTIKTNDTDAVTIDSSQNVGVGTASPSQKLEVNGSVQIGGVVLVETPNNTPLQVESTDAFCAMTLADTSGSVKIETSGGVIKFETGGDASTAGTNATEIARFTTEGLAIGGTGSANTLDDYEEGTFTPAIGFSTANPTAGRTTGRGRYTKIGQMVTVHATVVNFNVTGSSGDLQIQDLPFTSDYDADLVGYNGSVKTSAVSFGTDERYLTADIPDNLSYIRIAMNRNGLSSDFINTSHVTHATSDIYVTISYLTDS